MSNNQQATPAQETSHGKKNQKLSLNELLEMGKAKGTLNSSDIMNSIEDTDYDQEQIDRFYEELERNGVEITDDYIGVDDPKFVAEIENEIVNSLRDDVTTSDVGEMVMDKLRKIDEVSYVRFASVYRHFKDISSFQEAIAQLLKDS